MAKQTEVTLICDLTGEPAQETVEFGIDGVTYEIDLTDNSAGVLRDILADYAKAGRKVGKQRAAAARGTKAARSASINGNRKHTAAIREWARQAGLQVADRGRIQATTVAAFEAANPDVFAAAS